MSGFLTLYVMSMGLPVVQAAMPLTPHPISSFQFVGHIEGISEYRLPNDLQVLLMPEHSKPTITVNMVYRVGSVHENYGESGMAHLLEHLLFKGTASTPDVWAQFNQRGFKANGSTSFDRTNYFAHFHADPKSDNLAWYLLWLADVMRNSQITQANLASEMPIVRNEMERGENNPNQALHQQVRSAMYQWHHYGQSPIGTRSDIEHVNVNHLSHFYTRYYQPDNATLVITGDFDPDQTLTWIDKAFGHIAKPQRQLPEMHTQEPVQEGPREVLVHRVEGASIVQVAYHIPAAGHTDFVAMKMLAALLGDEPSGPLHVSLVKAGLAAQVDAFVEQLAQPGVLWLETQLAPGQDVYAARNKLLEVIHRIQTGVSPLTDTEFNRVRTQWLNAWDRGFTDPHWIGLHLSQAIACGDWRLFFAWKQRIEKLKLADIQRVASQYLRSDNQTVGIYIPTTSPQRASVMPLLNPASTAMQLNQEIAWSSTHERPGEKTDSKAWDPSPQKLEAHTERGQLPSGLKWAVLNKATRGDRVHARLTLHRGRLDNLQGQHTIALAAAYLTDKGAINQTRQQIQDEWERLQAEVSIGLEGANLVIDMHMPQHTLPVVMQRLAYILRHPQITSADLAEWRTTLLHDLQTEKGDPSAWVSRTMGRHNNPYPIHDWRYVQRIEEAIHAVQNVTVADVIHFNQRFNSAGEGHFVAVGPVSATSVASWLQTNWSDWTVPELGPQSYARIPSPWVSVPTQNWHQLTPDRANAQVLMATHLAISDEHPDFPALLMVNQLLGQTPSSRLWQRLRTQEKLSYYAHSHLRIHTQDNHAIWTISAIFPPNRQASVEAALNEEFRNLLTHGFTQNELDTGKQGLLATRRLTRSQDAVLTQQLAAQLDLGRTFEYGQKIDDTISTLTLDALNTTLRHYLRPSDWSRAWAGDFKKAP